MNNKYRLYLILLLLVHGLSFKANAQVPAPSNPPRLVNDFASLLSESENAQLEQYLVAYSDSTSTQITVVIMSDLQGYDVDDMAQRIGQKWGVGQKNTSNGLVMLIKPKVGNEGGKVAISTGYGLEEVITDAASRRIIDNVMIPKFKEEKYYEGIVAGVNIVSDLLMGKYKAEDFAKGGNKKSGGLFFLLLIIFIGLMLIFGKNNGDNNHTIGKKSNLPFWLLLSMLGNTGSRGGSGDWGGFSGGSGGFGGGGGGGFGGFGGGGFGGGGASGSW